MSELSVDRHRATALDHLLFGGLVILSVFHVPIIRYGDNSIGFFDLYVIAFAVYILMRSFSRGFHIGVWRDLLIGFWIYICYETIMVLFTRTPYSFLLVAKHIELFVVLFITIDYFENICRDLRPVFRLFQLVLVALTVFQILQFAAGGSARVGLPFKEGLSPNPAGFVLAVSIIFQFEILLGRRYRDPLTLLTMVLTCFALLLTMSRTNLLALFLTYSIAVGAKFWNVRVLLIGGGSVLLFLLILYLVAATMRAQHNYMNRIYNTFHDPFSLLADSSFMIRTTRLWPQAFRAWLRSPLTVLFGNGVGYFEIVDGTVPRLLVNLGVVGLVLFVYNWVGFYLLNFNTQAVRRLLILVSLNSITVETLVSSFRTVQIFIPLLVLIVTAARRIPDGVANAAHKQAASCR